MNPTSDLHSTDQIQEPQEETVTQGPESETPENVVEAAGETGTTEPESAENQRNSESAVDLIAKRLAETQKALEESQNQYMRLAADFDNFRKRKDREMADVIRFANEDLIKQILPVLDNFDRTLDVIEKTDNLTAVKEGIAMVSANFRKQLQKVGLEPLEAVGKPFDANLFEAITSVPAPGPEQVDKVIEEVEKGYKLKDKVIRFSKVIVGE